MLVLSREISENIVIDNNLEIEVAAITGDEVFLRITGTFLQVIPVPATDPDASDGSSGHEDRT